MSRWLVFIFLAALLAGCGSPAVVTPTPPAPPTIPEGNLPEPVYLTQTGGVVTIEFSRQNDLFVGVSTSGILTLWNWRTGTKIKEWQANDKTALSLVSFSPDGTRLAVCSFGDDIKVWEVETAQFVTNLEYKCSTNNLGSIVHSPDGKFLVAGSPKDSVRFWDVSNWKETKAIPINAAKLQFSADGTLLVIADTSGYIHFLDLKKDNEVNKVKIAAIFCSGLAITPDGKKLACKLYDGRIELLEVPTGEILYEISGIHTHGWDVDFSPDGSFLASSDLNGLIGIWDVESGELISTYTASKKSMYSDLYFSPDGTALAVASNNDTIDLWHFEK